MRFDEDMPKESKLTPRRAFGLRWLWILVLFVILLGILWAFLYGPFGRPRIVARAVTPDGTELCVVQESNHDICEPFYTSVVYRKPGGRWGWFYYDHQDIYWRRGEVLINPDAKRISVYRNGTLVVTFDWQTEIFRKYADKCIVRMFTNAQVWLPANWTVTNSVHGLL